MSLGSCKFKWWQHTSTRLLEWTKSRPPMSQGVCRAPGTLMPWVGVQSGTVTLGDSLAASDKTKYLLPHDRTLTLFGIKPKEEETPAHWGKEGWLGRAQGTWGGREATWYYAVMATGHLSKPTERTASKSGPDVNYGLRVTMARPCGVIHVTGYSAGRCWWWGKLWAAEDGVRWTPLYFLFNFAVNEKF